MSAFLIDEMFPTATAAMLRKTYGHDAVHVTEIGVRATEDAQVAATARAESRAVVTEMSPTSRVNAMSFLYSC